MSTKSKFKQRAKTPDREAQPFSEPSSPKPTFLQKLTSLVSNPRLVPDRSRSEPAVSITNKSVNLAKSSTPRDITHHPTFEPTQIDDHGIYFFPPYTGSPHSSILSALCPPRRARSDSINSNPSYRSVQSTESHTNIRSIEPQSVGLGISVGPSFHEHTHTSPLQQTKTINQSIDTYSSTPRESPILSRPNSPWNKYSFSLPIRFENPLRRYRSRDSTTPSIPSRSTSPQSTRDYTGTVFYPPFSSSPPYHETQLHSFPALPSSRFSPSPLSSPRPSRAPFAATTRQSFLQRARNPPQLQAAGAHVSFVIAKADLAKMPSGHPSYKSPLANSSSSSSLESLPGSPQLHRRKVKRSAPPSRSKPISIPGAIEPGRERTRRTPRPQISPKQSPSPKNTPPGLALKVEGTSPLALRTPTSLPPTNPSPEGPCSRPPQHVHFDTEPHPQVPSRSYSSLEYCPSPNPSLLSGPKPRLRGGAGDSPPRVPSGLWFLAGGRGRPPSYGRFRAMVDGERASRSRGWLGALTGGLVTRELIPEEKEERESRRGRRRKVRGVLAEAVVEGLGLVPAKKGKGKKVHWEEGEKGGAEDEGQGNEGNEKGEGKEEENDGLAYGEDNRCEESGSESGSESCDSCSSDNSESSSAENGKGDEDKGDEDKGDADKGDADKGDTDKGDADKGDADKGNGDKTEMSGALDTNKDKAPDEADK